jgi:hypothetical protein
MASAWQYAVGFEREGLRFIMGNGFRYICRGARRGGRVRGNEKRIIKRNKGANPRRWLGACINAADLRCIGGL